MSLYPYEPGAKTGGTSQEAAEGIAGRAHELRRRVLASLRRGAKIPEEIADDIGEPVHSVRPRCTELQHLGLIVKTVERRRAMGGRMATVLAVVPEWGSAA